MIYHFIGIKGAGMSSLAQVVFDMGNKVQGSDVEKYFFTEDPLIERGIKILPFSADNIKEGMIIVAGNAFLAHHEEIAQAERLGIPVIRYHKFIGELLKKYVSVGITGSHGKTSTTGLTAHVLKGVAPTSFLIGDGTGHGDPNSKYFVLEACEYRRHFLSYNVDYCIMTNIDYDHPDYYKDLDDICLAFQEMVHNTKKAVIACGDDQYLQELRSDDIPIFYYGVCENNNFRAVNIKVEVRGTTFEVLFDGNNIGTFFTPQYGNHNMLNALGVIALCVAKGCDINIIKEQVGNFGGVKRRFSEKTFGKQMLIDDFAHHPTEITITLNTARQKYPGRELVVIFQPHTFTRTRQFLKEFAEVLQAADKVYLCDIFGSARETSGDLSVHDLHAHMPYAEIILEENTEKLSQHKEAVLLFMGAGDVQKYQIAYEKVASGS